MTRRKVSLDGSWDRYVGGRRVELVQVPGSFRPTGVFQLRRNFPWKETAPGFLVIEGVAARASFFINGSLIGEAEAWAPYEFEIPRELLRDENEIVVEVADITSSFGPMPGRRFDGFVRSLHIERRPETYIDQVRFRDVVAGDLGHAVCEVEVKLSRPGKVEAALERNGRRVAGGSGHSSEILKFEVASPALWSPGQPALYTLRVTTAEGNPDVYEEKVGFRKLEIRGSDFYLNGERLLLKGVCRHEFMTEFGYAPPEHEVRRELALIRHAGFNFVRLVHSPQSPAISRLAAEVGLLVTEEPGTCFHDLGDETVAGPALEALRRLVLRDRNVPSILGWLIYNECHANTAYACRAAALCRELDPDGLVSFADCFGPVEPIEEMVKAANLSFYGFNLYRYDLEPYRKRLRCFPDKPLVFTEWGGRVGQGNARELESLCEFFVKHSRLGEPMRLAGTAFWAWADYEEFSRQPPAAIEGWTIEGLVDKRRRPKADLLQLSMMNFEMDQPAVRGEPRIEVLLRRPEVPEPWQPLLLSARDQAGLRDQVAALRAGYQGREPRFGRHLVDGILFDASAGPLLLGGGETEIVIPVGRRVRGIAVLGHVAFKGGYPYSTFFSAHHGKGDIEAPFGSIASEYVFEFETGLETQRLEHGIHLLRSNAICRWWLTELHAPEIVPALEAVVDPSYEILRVNLWKQLWPAARHLREIRWRLADKGSLQGMYAVSLLEGT